MGKYISPMDIMGYDMGKEGMCNMAILKLPFPPGGKVLSSDTGIMSQVSIDQLIENWWIFWGPVVWDSGDASK